MRPDAVAITVRWRGRAMVGALVATCMLGRHAHADASKEPAPTPTAIPPPAAVAPMPSWAPIPWYKDPLGDALVVGGAMTALAGAVLFYSSSVLRDDADRARTHAEYLDALELARNRRTASWIVGGVGGALIAGGVIRYVTRTDPHAPQVSWVPVTGGGIVAWSGRL